MNHNRSEIGKKVIGTEMHLYNPDINKPFLFHLYTVESGQTLGKVIMQNKKPIAFYPQRISTTQKQCTNIERDRELLSSIETCKE
jgi:hypothetical protein